MNNPMSNESISDRAGPDSSKVTNIANHMIPGTSGTRALTPAQLRDRSIIYRTDMARPEVDAFRDLRTKLLSAAEGNFITLVAPVSPAAAAASWHATLPPPWLLMTPEPRCWWIATCATHRRMPPCALKLRRVG